jgi:hypothetical protein
MTNVTQAHLKVYLTVLAARVANPGAFPVYDPEPSTPSCPGAFPVT